MSQTVPSAGAPASTTLHSCGVSDPSGKTRAFHADKAAAPQPTKGAT